MKRWILAVSLLLLPALALAGPPVNGTYYSTDQGGSVLEGNFSESWVAPEFRSGQVGNAIHAQSWDGATLGTMWRLHCPAIAASPTLISDSRDGNGSGFVTWSTTYRDGTLWLGAMGPWGDEDYMTDVLSMTVTSTHMYVENTLVDVTSNISIFGSFQAYTPCFEFVVTNAAINGNTDLGMTLPMSHPAFVEGDTCDPIPQTGAWGTVSDVTLTITGDCEVGTESRSWGALKARF